jgi:GT2 family glycosyltransferase
MTAVRLSAAVCTRDRPRLLERALGSLLRQSVPPAEILVVDNAPSGGETRALIVSRFPSVRYVAEPVPGLDFARNRALADARHEVLAFLDDDAVADVAWTGALLRVFESEPRAAVCTGRVEPLGLNTPGERLFEANGGFSRGLERIVLPDHADRPLHGRQAPLIAWAISVGSGCSYAVRRDVALTLGGFDEALDLGLPLPGGGDHDLLWRALRAGHTVVYEPEALAWHEHRTEAAAACDQIVGHQRAIVAFLAKHVMADRVGRPTLAGYTGWRLAKPGVRLVRRALGRDPLPAPVLLRMWWNCWLGLVAYPRARRLARERRERYAA